MLILCSILSCLIFLTVILNVESQNCPKQPDGNMMACCNMPKPIAETVQLDCVKKHGDQAKKKMESGKPDRGCCISECVMNSTKLYTGNGVVDKTEFIKLFSTAAAEDWKNIYPSFIDMCFQKLTEQKADLQKQFLAPPDFPNELICHPASGVILDCLMNMAFKNCPDSKFVSTPECRELKVYSQNCKIIPKIA